MYYAVVVGPCILYLRHQDTKKKVGVPYIRILSQMHAYPCSLLRVTASPSLLGDCHYSITQWGAPGEVITCTLKRSDKCKTVCTMQFKLPNHAWMKHFKLILQGICETRKYAYFLKLSVTTCIF